MNETAHKSRTAQASSVLAALLSLVMVFALMPTPALASVADGQALSEDAPENATPDQPANSDTEAAPVEGDPASIGESITDEQLADLQDKIDQAQNLLEQRNAEGVAEGAEDAASENETEEVALPGNIVQGVEDVDGVATISEGGVYTLANGAAGRVVIATTDAVTIIGNGCVVEEDGSISSPSTPVHIDATQAPGAQLILQGVHIQANADTSYTVTNAEGESTTTAYAEMPAVAFAGTGNTLTIQGAVALDADNAQATRANINVPEGASLEINGDGALYVVANGRAAAIGGNAGQRAGSITLGAAAESAAAVNIFAKTAGVGAAIGDGAEVSGDAAEGHTSGAITFQNVNANLATTSSAPAVGTTQVAAATAAAGSQAATAAPAVTLMRRANVNINVDGTGTAINTASGKLLAEGGALRTYVDGTADAIQAHGQDAAQQVSDAALKPVPTNAEGDQLVLCAIDTRMIEAADSPFTITVDDAAVFTGERNGFVFVQEAVDAGLVQPMTVVDASQNWSFHAVQDGQDAPDANLYLHLSPESHIIKVGEQMLLASWDDVNEAFTVSDIATVMAKSARMMERATQHKAVASVTGAGTLLINNAEEAVSSDTVTISAVPAEGNYLAQIRMASGVLTPGAKLDYQTIATPGAAGTGEEAYAATVELPADAQDVSIVADFVPVTWDGTIDTSWYNADATSFNLYYPAQFQGAAAIINGCFTTYPVKANGSPDYTAYMETMGYLQTEEGAESNNHYGEFSSTYTQPDAQGLINRDTQSLGNFGSIEGFGFSAAKTRTQRVVGDANAIYLYMDTSGGATATTSNQRFYGKEDFAGKQLNIMRDMDFGAFVTELPNSGYYGADSYWVNGVRYKWSTDSPVYMPLGGGYDMIPLVNNTNGYAVIGSSFNGTLDGWGHTFRNLYGEHFTAGSNYGDCRGVGVVGMLGGFTGQQLPSYGNGGSYTVSVRRLVTDETCYFSGRRSTGGIVGYASGYAGNTIVEYCINKAFVKQTDKFGLAGIVGGAYAKGVIDSCANFGTIWHYMANPTGGIAGYNHMDISNCFNAGYVNAGGSTYSMGIATCDGDGPKTVTNCYYIASSYNYQGSTSGGYFVTGSSDTAQDNGATSISLRKYNLSASLLNASGAVWHDDVAYVSGNADTKGANWLPTYDNKWGLARNFPMLWFQAGGSADSATYKVRVEESRGGTVSVSSTTGAFGDRVFLSYEAEKGYLFEGYMIETDSGNRYTTTSNSVGLTDNLTISGVFTKAEPAEVEWEDDRGGAWSLSVTETGIRESGSGYQDVTDSAVRNGGDVLQGNTIKIGMNITGSPADAEKEYTGAFKLSMRVAGITTETVELSGNASVPATYQIPAGVRFIEIEATAAEDFKSWATKADTTWFDDHSTDTVFTLNTPAELAGLSLLVRQGVTFEGKTVSLGSDIDMHYTDAQGVDRYWQNIGLDDSTPFSGTFDGQGHTVKGLRGYTVMGDNYNPYLPEGVTYTSGVKNGALFGLVSNGTIKNVTIGAENTVLSAGIALNSRSSVLENCVNEAENDIAGIVVLAGSQNVGDMSQFIGCVNNATVQGAGIALFAYLAEFEKCVNNGDIAVGPAGILGSVPSGKDWAVSFKDCANHGNVTHTSTSFGGPTSYGAGGIFGGYDVGRGIAARPTASITGCVNTGSISNTLGGVEEPATGGIAGVVSGTAITDCYNTGTISANRAYAGGIVGSLRNSLTAERVDLARCYSTGSVSSQASVGPIYGTAYSSVEFNNADNFALEAFQTEDGATVVSADELRGLASTLGAAYKATMPDENDGFPMLAWELPYDLNFVDGSGNVLQSIGLAAGYTNTDSDLIASLFTGDASAISGEGARKGYVGSTCSGWASEKNGTDPVTLSKVSGNVTAWPLFDTWIRDLAYATISGSVKAGADGAVTPDVKVVHDGTVLTEGSDYSLTCTPSLSGKNATVSVSGNKAQNCQGSTKVTFVVGANVTASAPEYGIGLEGANLGTSVEFSGQHLMVVPVVERYMLGEEELSQLQANEITIPEVGMKVEGFSAFDVNLFLVDLNNPKYQRSIKEFDDELAITFQVGTDADKDYSQHTAYVTQLHENANGAITRPLDSTKFPVAADGSVTVRVKQLSQFAITLASGTPIVAEPPADEQPETPSLPQDPMKPSTSTGNDQAYKDLLNKFDSLLGLLAAGSTSGNGASSGGVVSSNQGSSAGTPATPSVGGGSNSGSAGTASSTVEASDEEGTEGTASTGGSVISSDETPLAKSGTDVSASSADGAGVASAAYIPWWVWLVCAAAVVAVGGAVVIVIVRRRKEKENLDAM